MERVALTAELIESFAGVFLSPLYDNTQPTPDFHRECWKLYCEPTELAAIAAPRSHAKSTALTHDFALATVVWRAEDYIIIVSATEELAMGHLGDIAKELRENDELRKEFNIESLPTDSKSDIIVQFKDGHQARLVAKGSGQKMRGMKWNGKRPGLIICDDLEEDEQVLNIDRRRAFSRWFDRALVPCLRRGGKVRMHGTILHEDALLARVMSDKTTTWKTLLFKAHKGFDDFSEILWPEQFPLSRLKAIRQRYIESGDASGYSQEYLNDPRDNSEAYLRKADFLSMRDADWDSPKRIAVGCDFAVSTKDKANRTSFTVGGEDVANTLHIFDQNVGRWDTLQWTEVLFEIQERWNPEVFFVEDGVIWKSVAPALYKEMNKRGKWLNCQPINPTRDKASRGRDLQKRMRAGNVRFDKEADWYEGYEDELLRFTGSSDAALDDQFDSSAILAKGLSTLSDLEDEDFEDDETIDMRRQDPRKQIGRSAVTGY